MPAKKPVKKVPQKDIDAAAASVEAAIERLEVKEVDIEIERVVVPSEKAEETPKEDENEPEVKVSEEKESEKEESSEKEDSAQVEDRPATQEEEENETKEEVEAKDDEEVAKPAESSFSTAFPTEKKSEGGKKSKVIIVICLCIIFTILGFFGGYLYARNMGSVNSSESLSTDTAPVPSATPTPEEVDLSAYSIEVLNGSGVAGVAGTEQQALETDGFSVENTGNAETQDFAETVVAVTSSVPDDFIKKLKDSLSERYVLATDTESLASDSTYDVVVTVGSETVVDE